MRRLIKAAAGPKPVAKEPSLPTRQQAMPFAQFEVFAKLVGPEEGPAHNALRSYFVNAMSKAEAARSAGVARSTMTKYVAKWDEKLALLADVEWDRFLARYRQTR